MNQYAYDATDAEGRTTAGRIEAPTVGEAVTILARQGLNVTSIRLSPTDSFSRLEANTSWQPNLYRVLKSAQTWLPAIQSIREELPDASDRRKLASVVEVIRASGIESEEGVAGWLQRPHAIRLLPLVNSMGMLEPKEDATSNGQAERFAARLIALSPQNARKWWGSYPFVLLSVVSVLILLLAVFVVPIFRDMYMEFGLQLPAPTMFVIGVSDLITVHFVKAGLILLATASILGVVVFFWRRYAWTNRIFGRWVAGSASNLRAMSNFVAILAELLRLDAPVPVALRLAGEHCGHLMYQQAAQELAAGIGGAGGSYQQALISWKLPLSVMNALAAGAGGTPNVPLLEELAELYRQRSMGQFEWFSSALPVLTVVLVGLVVGFVVIALLMPMITLVSALT